MVNTLLIHMGIRKTGTTALQVFLYENAKKLEEYGWCYPDLRQEIFGVPFMWDKKEVNGGVFYKEWGKLDTRAENWDKAWECVLAHLKSKNVIVSSEGISVWGAEEFLEAAKEKYGYIKVIIYLRRQDRALESIWNQKVKNPMGYYLTFQEFIHSNGGEECSSYYYKKQLDAMSRIIGKENLIVRVYEKGQLCGDMHTTESDFLSAIGIVPNWKEWKIGCPQNLGLKGNYLEIKRVFGSIQNMEGIEPRKKKYADCFRQLSHTFCGSESEKGYFSSEERKNFLDQFAVENEEIAREYLHREDGILFYDNKMDYPFYNYKCTSFEEDLIRSLSTLLCVQDEEIQHLKRYSCALAEKLLLQNIKGRNFLLFGAGDKCKELLEQLKTPVPLIADNDERKNGKKLSGIDIVLAKEIKSWSDYFILVTCIETDEIEIQLQRYGLKKDENYVLAKEYFACY